MLSLHLQHRRVGVTRTLRRPQNPLSNTGREKTCQEPAIVRRTAVWLLVWVDPTQYRFCHAFQTPTAHPLDTKRGRGWSRKGAPPCAHLAPQSGQPLIPPDGSVGIAGCPHRGGRRPPPTTRPLVTKRGEGWSRCCLRR